MISKKSHSVRGKLIISDEDHVAHVLKIMCYTCIAASDERRAAEELILFGL